MEIVVRTPLDARAARFVKSRVLSIDPTLEAPPFQQIADQLRAFIERGDLRKAETLPTVRQLANDLGVAPNTVAKAYTDLQERGWLTSDGRRGTRVADVTPIDDVRARAALLRDDVDALVRTLRRRGYSAQEIRAAFRRV